VSDFTVIQYGIDVYGRPVYMTRFMADWFESYCEHLGRRPRILQGAYMERLGGGAASSEGAHDKAKCLDLDHMVRTARQRGAGAYRRDETWRHGSMRKHMHLTLGADAPGSPMAEILWDSYVARGDGLGIQPPQPDYEWRPDPLVLVPPEDDMTPEQAQQLDGLTKAVAGLADMVEALAEGNDGIKRRITKSKREILAAVKAD
jgi:hypothetical protein